MKKVKTLLAIMLAAVMCLIGAACDNASDTSGSAAVSSDSTGVSLILEDTVYTNDKGSINATWYNNSDKEMMYGYSFTVEKQTDGEWVEFKPTAELAFEDLGIMLEAGAGKEHTFDLSNYDFTEAGTYRIATDYSLEAEGSKKPQQTYDHYDIYAEFTVE